MDSKKERSFVAIKPDGIHRSLVGEIIGRFERTGLKLVAMKMVVPTEKQCNIHYNKDDVWFEEKGNNTIKGRQSAGMPIDKPAVEYGKDIVRALVKFMTCGPVVIMVWEGNKSVNVIKKLVGGTEPSTSAIGTIRGDLTIDSYDLSSKDERAVRNLIHCSDTPVEAEREITIWFKDEEIINYRHMHSQILYDADLGDILK